jgi:putative flippase GtrA
VGGGYRRPPAPRMPETSYVPLSTDPLRERLLRFGRALMVGGVATGADFATLTLLIRVFAVRPEIARAPALLAGAIVQFVGNRAFTFRATQGSLARHARLFLVFEASAYVVNLLLYTYLVRRIRVLPPEVTSFVGTFVVFAAYSYPVRRLVIFRLLRHETDR